VPIHPPATTPVAASVQSQKYIPAQIEGDEHSALLYNILVELYDGELKKATVAGAGTKVYMACRFRVYQGPRDMIRYYAKDLCRRMDNDPNLAGAWKATKMYAELREHIQQPIGILGHIVQDLFAHCLVRRKKSNPSQTQQQQEPADKTSRPNPQTDFMDVDEPPDVPQLEMGTGRRSGKVAGLRLVSARSSKRPGSDLDLEDEGPSQFGGKGLKRARYMENGNESENGNDEEADNVSDDMPSDGESNQELVELVVHGEALPSKKPDVNGIWTCQEDDCSCVVYNADEPEGQAAVEGHIYSHQDQMDLINLARVEGREAHRPYA
jgi:hypothetical protein